MKFMVRLTSLVAASALLGSGAVAAQECSVTRLNQTLPVDSEVIGYSIIRDGSGRVGFVADVETDDFFDLYTTQASGNGDPVLFDLELVPGRRAYGNPKFNPAGTRAVYRADTLTQGVIELFSIATTDGGGSPVRLNPDLPENGDVMPEFEITADGNTVVYLAEQDSLRDALYRAPILGGSSTRISGNLEKDVEDDFKISPGGEYAVYRKENESFREELFSVALDGGSPRRISDDLSDFGRVESFIISPDGNTVVYLADQETDNLPELFRVPIDGGDVEKINGSEVEFDVDDYQFSPDSQYVVYTAESRDGSSLLVEVYSATVAGGQAVRLSRDLPEQGFISRFAITPDSQTVIYEGSQDVARLSEIFSVPIAGGGPVKLSGDLDGADGTLGFTITPDSQRIVFTIDLDANVGAQSLELKSARITGGDPTILAGPFAGSFSQLSISPDSRTLVFSGELEEDDRNEIFSVSILGGGSVNKLNGALPDGGTVGFILADDFQITQDNRFVVYLADQDTQGVTEIWSADTTCGLIFLDTFEPPPT